MTRSCFLFSCVRLSWPARGQKVEVQKPDRGQILHVQTALNHLTVLEMTERSARLRWVVPCSK